MGASLVRGRKTWLSYLFLAFYSFFINSMGPLTPLLKSELGLSYTVGSLHYSAFALGILIVGLGGRALIVRLGTEGALWLGALGLGLGAIPLVLGRSPIITIGASFAMGLVGTLILIVVPSSLSDLHGEGRAVAISEANVLASVVAATAPLLLGYSTRLLGDWRPALAAVALVPLIFLPFLGPWRPRADALSSASPPRSPVAPQGPTEKAPLPRLYWAYWACLVLAVAAEFGMISWATDFLVSSHGLEKSRSATTLSIFLGAMILGRFLGSRFGGRARPETLLFLSLALALGGFFAFWLAPVLGLALAGLFFAGLGIACLYPFVLALAIGAARGQTVQASATATVASGAAIMVLPVLLGAAADAFGIGRAYILVPLVLGSLALLLLVTTARRN